MDYNTSKIHLFHYILVKENDRNSIHRIQVTIFYTPWTTASVCIARRSPGFAHIHLCMPMVRNSEVEILNIFQLT